MKLPWRRKPAEVRVEWSEEARTRFRSELRAELVEEVLQELARKSARNYRAYLR